MMWLAGIIGGMGIACMIVRKTLLGVLIGIQLLILGSTMMFVIAGLLAGLPMKGHIFGLFITLAGMAQLVAGYALAIRMFFLKKSISMDELRALKQ